MEVGCHIPAPLVPRPVHTLRDEVDEREGGRPPEAEAQPRDDEKAQKRMKREGWVIRRQGQAPADRQDGRSQAP